MQELAPIVLFAYNRPWHTKKTIEALKNNYLASRSILYIFSDGAKTHHDKLAVNEVRNYLQNINGFCNIIIRQRKENYGLAKSVIEGIGEILDIDDKVIVVEDDIVTSPMFLEFMNNSLEFYKDISLVYSISGYSFPVIIPPKYYQDIYFLRRSSSWGWATWKNCWNKAVWDGNVYENFLMNKGIQNGFNRGGKDLSPMLYKQISRKIDSWAIRWAFTHYLNRAFCIFPVKSLVKNIGMDGTGVHFTRKTSKYDVQLNESSSEIKFSNDLVVNEDIEQQILRIVEPGLISKLKNRLEVLIKKST